MAKADGIPISEDRKNVTGEYTRIVLDENQISDVETKRKVTLSAAQKAELEKIAGGPLGDIGVYSSRHYDCTCGSTAVMAIWTQKGVLDFPHGRLFTLERQQQLERKIVTDHRV